MFCPRISKAPISTGRNMKIPFKYIRGFDAEPTGSTGTACDNAVGKLISFFYFVGLYD